VNIDQLCRLGAFNAAAIKKAGTLSPFVTQSELYAWANEANRKLEHKLRMTQMRYFTRTIQSTDVTLHTISGITYQPSASLVFAANTNYAELPPDFQELVNIRFLDSSLMQTPLTRLDMNKRDFRDVLNASTVPQNPGTHMFYDIIGERRLIFVPTLNTAVDVEITYVARQKRMISYSTGTILATTSTPTITGSGTTWRSGAPFDSHYLDIMFGTSGVSTVPTADPSIVYDGVSIARVASIDNDTAITLATNKVGSLAAGTGYMLSSVPAVPEDYHSMLADYVGFRILLKAGDPGAQRSLDGWQDALADLATTAARRNTADHETIEDWNPWTY
jgi:hypothetical protein